MNILLKLAQLLILEYQLFKIRRDPKLTPMQKYVIEVIAIKIILDDYPKKGKSQQKGGEKP